MAALGSESSNTCSYTSHWIKNQLFAVQRGWTFCEASFIETCLQGVDVKYQFISVSLEQLAALYVYMSV